MPNNRKQDGLVRAGQLELLAGLAKDIAITRDQEKLINAGVEISQAPNAVERAYLARELVQCTLPHKDPGNIPAWSRKNGDLLLTIQPAWDAKKNVSIGYPYGVIPRLLLFWLTTEAIREKKRRLQLGRRLSAFMRALGLNPETGRGQRGDARRLRSQMERLFRCRISLDLPIEEARRHGKGWHDMEVAPKGLLWWDPVQPDNETLLDSWIELGEDFFQAIIAAPVPADMRALRALKRSPLALDLYVWATHKAFLASVKGRPQFVRWSGLLAQFGADYKRQRDFKEKAIAALKKIQIVYPGLKLENGEGGLVVLASSRPAIPAIHSSL